MHVTSGLVSPAQHHSSCSCQSQHMHGRGGSSVHRQAFISNNCSRLAASRRAGVQGSGLTSGLLTGAAVATAAEGQSKAAPLRITGHVRQALCGLAAPETIAVATQTGSSCPDDIVPGSSLSVTAAGLLKGHEYDEKLQLQEQDMQTLHSQPQQHVHQQHISLPSEPLGTSQVWLPEKQLLVPQTGKALHGHRFRSAAIEGLAPAEQHSQVTKRRTLSRVYMAASATRGRKKSMEDRHVLAALDPSQGVEQALGPIGLQDKVSVAAVFDGHAGYATAAYAAQHIPNLLHEALSGRPGSRTQGGPVFPQRGLLAPTTALAASFYWFDRWWADARCDPTFTQHGWDDSGSTAVVGMVYGQDLVVANAGDSVALLARGGRSQRLTVEHRLDNQAEAERVLEAGGRVVAFKPGAVPRVMGSSSQTRFKGSMVTRALGDFAFKHPQALISADPHVAAHQLTPADRLVVLTSDGVTDVLPDDDLLDIAIAAIEQTQLSTNNGQALAKAAANAVMSAALDGGSTDNITVVTILLDWDCEYAAD